MRLTQVFFSNYFKRYVERELHQGKLRRQWHPLTGWKEMKRKKFAYNEHRPWTDEFKMANQLGKRVVATPVKPLKEWSVFVGDQRGVARSLGTQITRNVGSRGLHTSVAMAADVPEGVLLGVGNPLLDITIATDTSFLDKYDLKANNAIIAGERQQGIYDDMMTNFKPVYVAGGATQNSIRVAQWLLGRDQATTFFGCVGNDERGKILSEKAREAGVNVQYMSTKRKPTGVCGAVITDDNRSLVADLGAADFFAHCFIESQAKWNLVKQASMFYVGGFVFPVCNQVIFDLGKESCDNNKIFTMNLSATMLCKYFADTKVDIMPYVDVLFGNETEAAEFCRLRGLSTESDNIEALALKTSQLPKANGKRSRMVVFTQGTGPTIIAHNDKVTSFETPKVSRDVIKDTNGCGDAFVGGFLSQLVQGRGVAECVACGQYAARTVIQHWGCTFPDKPQY